MCYINYSIFQESLKKMREVDDKIVYALNLSIPTESFKGQISAAQTCHRLYGELNNAHLDRENAIRKCIAVSADGLKTLKIKRDENRDDILLDKEFKSQQRKVFSVFRMKVH